MKLKNTAFLLLSLGTFASILVGLSSCSTQKIYAGILTKQKLEVADFTKLKIEGTYIVNVRKGPFTEVILIGPSDLPTNKILRNQNGVLEIRASKGTAVKTIELFLTTPELNAIEVGGETTLKTTSLFEGELVQIEAKGGSRVLWTGNHAIVTVDASGLSKVKLSGTSKGLVIDGSGSSEISAEDFRARSAEIASSGLSKIAVYATASLSATASGISRIEYFGNPQKKDFNKTGSGLIVKQNRKTL